METLEIVKTAVEALRDKKAEDVTVIDITGVSSIADYFIIANGNNQNQLTAMQDAVDEALYKAGRVTHVMMILVTGFNIIQNFHSLVKRGRFHQHLLETTFQSTVFLYILAILV